ncbi:MAG: glycosyltransferase family 4 protein [Acidobacteriota bacterium]|nr:glycosyltransferase family 4 protein [Acidobacteriota bacterium]
MAASQPPLRQQSSGSTRFEKYLPASLASSPNTVERNHKMSSQGSALLSGPFARLKARTLTLEEKLTASLRLRSSASLPSRVAVIGNYLPRQCGIATFTTDLCDAISAEYEATQLLAVPVNDAGAQYNYPRRVRFELMEGEPSTYEDAADFLNFSNVDLVCLQHEYGIFGGPAGSHILRLLRRLKMPLVTTLHTVLREPDANQRAVMDEIASLSDRLIVMSEHSSRFLREVFHVPDEKIDVIPHGVPDLPFGDPNYYKDSSGTEGRAVLLTFGLLSPNKGIETVIEALPRIVVQHPEAVYVIVGATHPHIKRHEGDQYRLQLQALARKLGVERNVIFHNRFVSPEEMAQFVGSADIYITPYRYEAQAVSGTLAYALGAGKAIISTPYWHATELLDDGRGVLVPFEDSAAMAAAAIELLNNEARRHAMRKRAYLFARDMVWNKVAQSYMSAFVHARSDRMQTPRIAFSDQNAERTLDRLPSTNLDHLYRMTDHTGLLQHAVFSVPNYREGYATDDNARALIVAIQMEHLGLTDLAESAKLASCYLAFLWHAFNPATGRFRNFLTYERQWHETEGSEDCHGRALWGLGTVLGRSKSKGLVGAAGRLFESAVPAIRSFSSPRAWAFAALGLQEYLESFPGDRAALQIGDDMAHRLLDLYKANSSPGWNWFEDVLAYSNARLPQALIACASRTSDKAMLDAGLESLDWFVSQQRCEIKGHFVPIGSQGFYRKGGEKARFDQQPVEAGATVSACLEALRVTGDERWHREAWSAFNWFLGDNDLQIVLYDSSTGGCRDGLHPDRANENQGAESTLSFLMALLEMRILGDTEIPLTRQPGFAAPGAFLPQHGALELK